MQRDQPVLISRLIVVVFNFQHCIDCDIYTCDELLILLILKIRCDDNEELIIKSDK